MTPAATTAAAAFTRAFSTLGCAELCLEDILASPTATASLRWNCARWRAR
jgi:hypothetical protein